MSQIGWGRSFLVLSFVLVSIFSSPTYANDKCGIIITGTTSIDLITKHSLKALRASVLDKLNKDRKDLLWFQTLLRNYGENLLISKTIAPPHLIGEEKEKWMINSAETAMSRVITQKVLESKEPAEVSAYWFGTVPSPKYMHVENTADLLAFQVLLAGYTLDYIDATTELLNHPNPPSFDELPFALADLRRPLLKHAEADVPRHAKYRAEERHSEHLKERLELITSDERTPTTTKDFIALQRQIELGFADQISWPINYLDYVYIAQRYLSYQTFLSNN